MLQARKLKYKLEDVRRRGRREEVGKVDNGEFGRTGEQVGRTGEQQAGRTGEQAGRTDTGEKKREVEEQEHDEGEVEERSEVTQVCNILRSKCSFNYCYH